MTRERTQELLTLASATISDCQGVCNSQNNKTAYWRTWKSFLSICLALFRFTILSPERSLALTPMFNHRRAVFQFCEMPQIYWSWCGCSSRSKKHENLHYQRTSATPSCVVLTLLCDIHPIHTVGLPQNYQQEM